MVSYVSGFVSAVIVNPLPKNFENETLLIKFHRISQLSPFQDGADFVSYIFQSYMIWITAVTEIFCSTGCAFSESLQAKKGERKKEFTKWVKSAAYCSWVSLCLPPILSAGVVFKDARAALSGVPKPMTEDYHRRESIGLKEEVDELEAVATVKNKELEDMTNQAAVFSMQLDELGLEDATDATGGFSMATLLTNMAQVREQNNVLLAQVSELEVAGENLRERDTNLTDHEKELEAEVSQLKEQVAAFSADVNLAGDVKLASFLRNLHRQRNGDGEVTFSKAELDRTFGPK